MGVASRRRAGSGIADLLKASPRLNQDTRGAGGRAAARLATVANNLHSNGIMQPGREKDAAFKNMIRRGLAIARDERSAGPERERVIQNPQKHTQPMSDGAKPRLYGQKKRGREAEKKIGVGTVYDSERTLQAFTQRDEGKFSVRGAKSSRAARAGAIYAHDQASRGYAHARRLRAEGGEHAGAVRRSADDMRAAAKANERKAKRLAKQGR